MTTTPRRTRLAALVAALAGLVAVPSASALAVTEPTAPVTADVHDARHDTAVVYAHRGASGHRPEHTWGAYQLAASMGADFTLAELRTLRAFERLPALRQHNTLYNGRWQVPTFEETLRWRAELSRREGRTIGIIPEIKHSTYLHAQGLDPEAALMALVTRYGPNRKGAPLWVQSFEWGNLARLRNDLGHRANLVFLADATGGPYDLVAAGTPRSYDELLTPSSLKQLARVVDGVAPFKERVISRTAAGDLGRPTTLVADAHGAGLKVTVWTMRAAAGRSAAPSTNGPDRADGPGRSAGS